MRDDVGATAPPTATLIRTMLLVASGISLLVAVALALGVIPPVAAGDLTERSQEEVPGQLRIILGVQLFVAALFLVLGFTLRRRSRLAALPLGLAAICLLVFTVTFVARGMAYFDAGPGLKGVAPLFLLAGLGDFLAFTLAFLGAYRSLKA